MSAKITRRNFLKLTGAGAAAAVVLTGCGPAQRGVRRQPYYAMPEFAKLGESTYYATTCRECPAGCGIIMRTMEGRAIKAEGNPQHPVSQGKICSRGLTAVQGLYNPDRITGPVRRLQRGEAGVEPLASWDEAVSVVTGALQNAGGSAFLMGLAPDHLFDLVSEISQAVGAPAPVRYSAEAMYDGRDVLLAAMQNRFGRAAYPYFDIANADFVVTFGGDFLGQWLSPVSYGRAYGAFRRSGPFKMRGYMIAIEPRMSVTSGAADEWIAVPPGSEGLIAQVIAGQSDPAAAAETTGIAVSVIQRLADLWQQAQRPLAIVGGSALSHANGLAIAEAVLALNEGRVNQEGGMYLTPGSPLAAENGEEAAQPGGAFSAVQNLIDRMNAGQVQALFIHGVNPIFDLPPAMGFAEALANVPLVISFASFPDETALQSDYVLPDHTGLESFGYQTNLPGTPLAVVSAMQPVVAPFYNTRATADVLIAAAQQAGANIPYNDEVAFIQARVNTLMGQGGSVDAADETTFWSVFLQQGGWWASEIQADEGSEPAAAGGEPAGSAAAQPVQPPDENTFHLITYPTQFGDGSGANRPWLQETPNPMTTVTWNSWVEINPETARRLGIANNDMVRITSEVGSIEAPAYLYPAIRPDTVAIPFGQGHTALGRYAEGRGVNPLTILQPQVADTGGLVHGDTLVTLEPTGRKRPLARLESIEGVYGDH